jgi:predicted glycogen debranching enzyme
MSETTTELLPPPIVIACPKESPEAMLDKEWLLTNSIGAFASGTAGACNARRYHALLVAAANPPVGRLTLLNCLLDKFVITSHDGGQQIFDLSTFEFDGKFLPDARKWLWEFRNAPAATFVYRCGAAEIVKEIILADAANAVAVRYRLTGYSEGVLHLQPFVSIRDYHQLRAEGGAFACQSHSDGVLIRDAQGPAHAVYAAVEARRQGGAGPQAGKFHFRQQWWKRFRYRNDIARGQDGYEDLFTPGHFEVPLAPGATVQFTAALDEPIKVDFDAAVEAKRQRQGRYVAGLGQRADDTTRRLAAAADTFIVARRRQGGREGATIMAGYHWFIDWGRDALIALPGLLLETRQFDTAAKVLRTFAAAIDQGMIPNCFNEYGSTPLYNSIDASLWFVLACDRYARESGDEATWRNELAPAVEQILAAYHDGTRFYIHADGDGLLCGGDPTTQITWMDAQFDNRPLTPRWGKCVEINALWHAALLAAGRRGLRPGSLDPLSLARQVGAAFGPTFWNEARGCLFDCVGPDWKDDTIRPNQIIAVSLPDCPLPAEQKRSVVEVVRRELLTPYGLRTLAPADVRYRGRIGGSVESRERAYHQGNVWPWLIGPFIEAYLRVRDFSPAAKSQANQWLSAFDDHLRQTCLGSISEIFEGDAPHHSAGTIAQAWSVAEVLRAKRLARG